jgi:type IV pilus assembly protein PilC
MVAVAKFRFVAMDAKGGETEGVITAENQSEAIGAIRSKGLFPTKVLEVGGAGAKKTPAQAMAKRSEASSGSARSSLIMQRLLRSKVKPKHLMVLTRQLATLVQAGLPLLRGLRILLKQEKNSSLREALGGMGEAVEGGSTFSEALSHYPHIFDKLFVNMVKAGEAGGVLDVVLARLAEFMEKAERVKNKVKSAMVYPIVVLFFAQPMCRRCSRPLWERNRYRAPSLTPRPDRHPGRRQVCPDWPAAPTVSPILFLYPDRM